MKAMNDAHTALRSTLRGSPTARMLAALACGALLCSLLDAPLVSLAVAQTAQPQAPTAAVPSQPTDTPIAPPETAPAISSAAPTAVDDSAEPSADANSPPPPVTDASLPSTLPRDLTPWGMFLSAVLPVKIVMVGLALASLATWTVWLAKTIELWNAKRLARRGLVVLADAKSLRAADKMLTQKQARSPMARLIGAAVGEADRSEGLAAEGVKDRAATLLSRIEAQAGRVILRGTGILATIGATAPFVGLFGTVWGIMDSFIGISKTNTTNLAVVAPGIAEALLATAMGLIAAIPAVVMYNGFARAITGYRAQLGDAAAEILRHLSRDLDSEDVPQKNATPVVRLHPTAE